MVRFYTVVYKEKNKNNKEKELFDYLANNNINIEKVNDLNSVLMKIGMTINNNSKLLYKVDYPINDDNFADALENEVIEISKKYNIVIEKLDCYIDYEKLISFALSGTSNSGELIIKPTKKNNSGIEIISECISKLDAKNKTLIITDPFIFPYKYDDNYKINLVNLLLSTNAKRIIFRIPVDQSRYNKKFYNSFKKEMGNIEISIKVFVKCHDRFWLCKENKRGFVMGSSFNEISNKISRIDMLEEKEVTSLLKMLG